MIETLSFLFYDAVCLAVVVSYLRKRYNRWYERRLEKGIVKWHRK